jgi:putative transposase
VSVWRLTLRDRSARSPVSQLVSIHGASRYLCADNGPEFVSNGILKWAAVSDMEMALGDPDKPRQYGAGGEEVT